MISAILLFYLLIGVAAIIFTYEKLKDSDTRAIGTSIVIALFFSFGLAIDHGIMPAPTLILIILSVFDFLSQTHDQDGTAIIFIPFIIQWYIIYLIFKALDSPKEYDESA